MQLSQFLLNEAGKKIYDKSAEEIVAQIGHKPNAIKNLSVQLHYARKEGWKQREQQILKAIELIKKGIKPVEHKPAPSPQAVKPEKPKTQIAVTSTTSRAEKILDRLHAEYSPKDSLKRINKFLENNKALTTLEKSDLEQAKKILEKRLSAGDIDNKEEDTETHTPKQSTKKTYDEISTEMGMSKMGGQKATQRALVKVYKGLRQQVPDATPEQIVAFMAKHFDPDLPDMKKIINILPSKRKKALQELAIAEDMEQDLSKALMNESYVERLHNAKPHTPMTSSYYKRERDTYIIPSSANYLYSHYFSGAKNGFRTIKHYFSIAKANNDKPVMEKLLQVAKIIDAKDKAIRN